LALAFGIAALCLAAPQASAGSAQAAPSGGFDPSTLDEVTQSVKQIPLTEEMVNRLIDSYPDMRAASAKFGMTQMPEQAPSPDGSNSDLDAMPADKRSALEDVAKKHGFKDLDEWSTAASSVVMSYAYAMQGKKPGSLEEAVKMNIEHAKNDPSLTADEKAQTIEQYKELGTKLARLEPLQQNYDLVLKMKEKLTPIMEAR
jgi:hypothetical protein